MIFDGVNEQAVSFDARVQGGLVAVAQCGLHIVKLQFHCENQANDFVFLGHFFALDNFVEIDVGDVGSVNDIGFRFAAALQQFAPKLFEADFNKRVFVLKVLRYIVIILFFLTVLVNEIKK